MKRIADVLRQLDADIIALQEIFSSSESYDGQVETLASTLEMESAFGLTRHHRGRPYGNAILSRWPILESRIMDLTWGQRVRRGCIRADLKSPHGTLHVYNIHMGTNFFERRLLFYFLDEVLFIGDLFIFFRKATYVRGTCYFPNRSAFRALPHSSTMGPAVCRACGGISRSLSV